MQEILHRFLPPPPKVVLDVGGGSGPYSCWLAHEGYETHLVDPVPKHLDQARRASASQAAHPIASIREGDARSLDQDDESVDVVLLMGPLYHLTSREDRIKALVESRRVLRVGGLVVAKAINRFASLFDGLTSGHIDDPSFIPILERDLDEGQHRNPEGHADYFTTAFFHRPEELEAEVRDAGFTVKELVAVQGPGWLAKDLDERWSDTSKRDELLRIIRMVEGESTLLGLSQHFVVLGQK
jgi:ubiquinone/menaquinone biosynthesis C-methylase UbiE